MLSLLLFNWIGYRLVISLLEQRATKTLVASINKNNYDDSQLIELRVDLNLPYQNDWADFERFNGEIEIDGTHYQYVKRKIEKGQLVVLCLPDKAKTAIKNTGDDYFKMVNDLQQDATGKKSEKSHSFSFKGLFNEFRSELNDWSIAAPLSDKDVRHVSQFALAPSYKGSVPAEPPELC